MIYTKATDELEIFEPAGADMDDALFKTKEMYTVLAQEMKDRFGLKKLLTPNDYCPTKMSIFQAVEGNEVSMWDTEGYCAVWTIWYTEMRLANPKLTTRECIELAMHRLLDMGSLRSFIWNYDRWVRRELEKQKTPLKRVNVRKPRT